ncbi:hypothetical protein [Labrys monachus]|uniref:Uncharacterized protein n=1 Tax=Labrys monachus TaxID=217067 RepID=A0ABU0F8V2_9HYPH|nr:hypothetical protein [Labrys monachus]MDQ0391032.1 hypothetical protein [Labrys monachus]
MHRLSTSFILGYHGCDKAVAEDLLAGKPFRPSNNDYDWLGPGIYFWEANPQRGLDFAIELSKRKRSSVKIPTVIGAILDLGLCLDMTTLGAIQMVRDAHTTLVDISRMTGTALPRNSTDLMRRSLDCAVIRRVHSLLNENSLPAVDSVRGIFIEGEQLYASSGFYEKTHVQIAVVNSQCIKGVFRVPDEQLKRWTA